MTLRFTDSFDHYATADFTQKWTLTGSGTYAISAGNGRRSTACFRFSSPASGTNVLKTVDSHATLIVGFAFRFAGIGSSSTVFAALMDAGSVQVDVRANADGTLSVTRNGTTLSTTAVALSANIYYYIEFKATIHDTTGSYDLRVDGVSVTSGTNVDTKNTSNATANGLRLGSTNSLVGASNWDFDDLYICDGAGATNNDFLGDVRVDAYLPNGNGNSSQLVGSDGNSTDNYLLVDESSQNGDTDYVASATVSEKDTYAFANMAHTPSSIFGVQINIIAKKDDAGTRSIQSVIRSGGSDTDGTSRALATSYADYRQIAETDPNTAAAWTSSGFNAAEFGTKVAA